MVSESRPKCPECGKQCEPFADEISISIRRGQEAFEIVADGVCEECAHTSMGFTQPFGCCGDHD